MCPNVSPVMVGAKATLHTLSRHLMNNQPKQTRKQIAAKLRAERLNQPSRSSEDAYAQMERANPKPILSTRDAIDAFRGLI